MAKPRKSKPEPAAARKTTTVPRPVRPPKPTAENPAQKMLQSAEAPGAVITRRAADRLRAGYLWVYASDMQSVVAPEPEQFLIPVADQRGIFLGTALYSPMSQFPLRLVSRQPVDHAAWLELIASRLRARATATCEVARLINSTSSALNSASAALTKTRTPRRTRGVAMGKM